MQQALGEYSFTIVLQPDEVENTSAYWQSRCSNFYDEMSKALPEGSINALPFKGVNQGKYIGQLDFSTLIFKGISGHIFACIIKMINGWFALKPTIDINIPCPNGITIKVTKLSVSELSKFLDENSDLSVCEALNRFIKSH